MSNRGGRVAALVLTDFSARLSYGFARTPLLPLYAAFLGAGPELIGIVGAAATLTGVVVKLPAGVLSDSLGKRRFLLGGLSVFALGPFLYLLVRGPGSLVGIRLAHGLATAFYSPVAMAVVATAAAERRGEALAWLSNSKILGKLGGAFFGGALLSFLAGQGWTMFGGRDIGLAGLTRADFHVAYLACGALGLLALGLGCLATTGLPIAPPDRPRTLRELGGRLVAGTREIVGDARVLVASGCEGVQNLTVGIVEHFVPVYAVFVAGCSPMQAGALYGVQIITTVASKPVLGRFSDRRGRRGVILLGLWSCALPFAAIPWTTSFWLLALLASLFGLGEALVTAAAAAAVADLCHERSMGAAMGVFGTIKDVGHAAGPVLGGVLIATFGPASGARDAPEGYRVAFAAVAILLVAYAALFARATRK